MDEQLLALAATARDEISGTENLRSLDDVRVAYLGKKGQITTQLKTLGTLPPAERKSKGQQINEIKQQIQQALKQRREQLARAEVNADTLHTPTRTAPPSARPHKRQTTKIP